MKSRVVVSVLTIIVFTSATVLLLFMALRFRQQQHNDVGLTFELLD
jgi:hypothetical protein